MREGVWQIKRVICTFVFTCTAAGLSLADTITPKQVHIAAPKAAPGFPHAITALSEESLKMHETAVRDRHHKLITEPYKLPRVRSVGEPTAISVPIQPTVPTPLNSTETVITRLRDRILSVRETDGYSDLIAEPSIAVQGGAILMTGNVFASFCSNVASALSTFRPISPYEFFPPANPGFCCDQVVTYDPKSDTMFWVLQYDYNANGNFDRLAVAHGTEITNGKWWFYDISPKGIGNYSNEWFDFPSATVTDQFLYISTNSFSTKDQQPWVRGIVFRVPIARLAAHRDCDLEYFADNNVGSICLAQGPSNTMYAAGHAGTNEAIRVFTWQDMEKKIITDDVTVDRWGSAINATAPDSHGADWLVRNDPRITAAWVNKDTIGFGWTAPSDVNFRFPHVRVAVLDRQRKLLAQPHIFNTDFGYAYPAAAANKDGRVGITLSFGGKDTCPSTAIGILDVGSDIAHATWHLSTSAAGKGFPHDGHWGDYLTIRAGGPDGSHWFATSSVLGDNGLPEIGYHEFIVK